MTNISSFFQTLDDEITNLRNIYLPSLGSGAYPTDHEQELARAFTIFSHAEIEHYVERICDYVSDIVLDACKKGYVTNMSLSFLAFNMSEPINGGDRLSDGKHSARKLMTQYGKAHNTYQTLTKGNEGIREKHLAKLLVPLGVTANTVDPYWLTELDNLATSRGQIAHMSRSDSEANFGRYNPEDVWKRVKGVVYANGTANSDWIASLQDLDMKLTIESGKARRLTKLGRSWIESLQIAILNKLRK